jgi:hypothetical protein
MAADAYELEEVRHRIERERAALQDSMEGLERAFTRVSSRLGGRQSASAAAALLVVGVAFVLVRRRRRSDRAWTVAARVGRYALVRLP